MSITAENYDFYTYADYLQWPENERWEIINGIAFSMSPSPSREHQKVSLEISRQIGNFLKDKSCEIYSSPLDVRLSENYENNQSIITVVQPDLIIVCDKSKLDTHGCKGAPDIVIEIISPSTAKRDTHDKFNLYEKYKVKEYWLVYPLEKQILIFTLNENNQYGKPLIYTLEETLECRLLQGLSIELKEVFKD